MWVRVDNPVGLQLSPMLLLKRTALVVLSQRFLMTRIRLVVMYFFMVAHKAASVHAKPC